MLAENGADVPGCCLAGCRRRTAASSGTSASGKVSLFLLRQGVPATRGRHCARCRRRRQYLSFSGSCSHRRCEMPGKTNGYGIRRHPALRLLRRPGPQPAAFANVPVLQNVTPDSPQLVQGGIHRPAAASQTIFCPQQIPHDQGVVSAGVFEKTDRCGRAEDSQQNSPVQPHGNTVRIAVMGDQLFQSIILSCSGHKEAACIEIQTAGCSGRGASNFPINFR